MTLDDVVEEMLNTHGSVFLETDTAGFVRHVLNDPRIIDKIIGENMEQVGLYCTTHNTTQWASSDECGLHRNQHNCRSVPVLVRRYGREA